MNDMEFRIRCYPVLEFLGVPHDFPLLLKHGSRIFDKRTKLYREATEVRRAQLLAELDTTK